MTLEYLVTHQIRHLITHDVEAWQANYLEYPGARICISLLPFYYMARELTLLEGTQPRRVRNSVFSGSQNAVDIQAS